ncbi:hypothetical protein ACH5RR_025690 [Cinchona calisaya]|uniref:Uncharacterized protein n=1 Tax=Cinchona calisaya TaxID=153742 RepID=A0ABD2Z5E9_9GENT
MAGREVREYTNLTDPKDKKWAGKGKIDDEEITFQRMVAKMQEVAGERGGYLHGRGALDSDDLLYLKEQMEAEEDAERLLRRTEKRAFAAFKISFSDFSFVLLLRVGRLWNCPAIIPSFVRFQFYDLFSLTVWYKAVADASPASVPLPLRVEPKPKSGIRQQDLLKRVVEVKPKRQRHSNAAGVESSVSSSSQVSDNCKSDTNKVQGKEVPPSRLTKATDESKVVNPVKSLLLAYESSDDED